MPGSDEGNEILSLRVQIGEIRTCNTNRLAHIGARHGGVINFLGKTRVERAIISSVNV